MHILIENWQAFTVLFVLLLFSAFFSSIETAFFTLNPQQILKFSNNSSRISMIVTSLLRNQSALLVASLFGNLTVNILFFSISIVTALNIQKGMSGTGQFLTGILSLVIIILFGEILPKAFGMNNPVLMVRFGAYPIYFWVKISTPFRYIINIISSFFINSKNGKESKLSIDEMKMLLNLSKNSGKISKDTADIIEDILLLSTVRINKLLLPRGEIVSSPETSSIDKAIRVAMHHRIHYLTITPKNNPDLPLGYIDIKRVFSKENQKEPLSKFITPAVFVPETKNAGQLLNEMLTNNLKVVYAVDEFGGVVGMLTVNIVLKELIGSFFFKNGIGKLLKVKKIAKNMYILNGAFPLSAWNDNFDKPLEIGIQKGVSSIGGLITSYSKQIPSVGDVVDIGKFHFKIDKMSGQKIELLTLTVNNFLVDKC